VRAKPITAELTEAEISDRGLSMIRTIAAVLVLALLIPVVAQARSSDSSSCCRTSRAHDGHTYRHPITQKTK
jgi:hypothetical protein